MARARRAWSEFHWGRPSRGPVRRASVPDLPKVLVKLGQLEALTYKTRKGEEPVTHYTHDFGEGGGRRPVLAMDPGSRKLHIVGGSYTVTKKGIEG